MLPQTWCVSERSVAKGFNIYFEMCVVNDAYLGQAIHALTYFHIYIFIINIICEVVLFHDLLGDERCFDVHVFVGVHWSVLINVLGETIRLEILWTVSHHWPEKERFVFNWYKN